MAVVLPPQSASLARQADEKDTFRRTLAHTCTSSGSEDEAVRETKAFTALKHAGGGKGRQNTHLSMIPVPGF